MKRDKYVVRDEVPTERRPPSGSLLYARAWHLVLFGQNGRDNALLTEATSCICQVMGDC